MHVPCWPWGQGSVEAAGGILAAQTATWEHLSPEHPHQKGVLDYSQVFSKYVGILNGFDVNTVQILLRLYLHLQSRKFLW